jgi:hypothetical protein
MGVSVGTLPFDIVVKLSVLSVIEFTLFVIGVVTAFKFYIGNRYAIIMCVPKTR